MWFSSPKFYSQKMNDTVVYIEVSNPHCIPLKITVIRAVYSTPNIQIIWRFRNSKHTTKFVSIKKKKGQCQFLKLNLEVPTISNKLIV